MTLCLERMSRQEVEINLQSILIALGHYCSSETNGREKSTNWIILVCSVKPADFVLDDKQGYYG